jgi:hypothetical protein
MIDPTNYKRALVAAFMTQGPDTFDRVPASTTQLSTVGRCLTRNGFEDAAVWEKAFQKVLEHGECSFWSGTPGWRPSLHIPQHCEHASAGGAALSTSIAIGTASADRLVVVATNNNGGDAMTSVVVNGVTLTADQNGATDGVSIFSGLVASGSGPQTVTVTWASGSFQIRGFALWTVTGLSSNLANQKTSFTAASGTISVTAGDLMFAIARGSGSNPSWSTSTQIPAAVNSCYGPSPTGGAADWTMASTNASFSVAPNAAGLQATAVATYR